MKRTSARHTKTGHDRVWTTAKVTLFPWVDKWAFSLEIPTFTDCGYPRGIFTGGRFLPKKNQSVAKLVFSSWRIAPVKA
jgi:hypothetical protein